MNRLLVIATKEQFFTYIYNLLGKKRGEPKIGAPLVSLVGASGFEPPAL